MCDDGPILGARALLAAAIVLAACQSESVSEPPRPMPRPSAEVVAADVRYYVTPGCGSGPSADVVHPSLVVRDARVQTYPDLYLAAVRDSLVRPLTIAGLADPAVPSEYSGLLSLGTRASEATASDDEWRQSVREGFDKVSTVYLSVQESVYGESAASEDLIPAAEAFGNAHRLLGRFAEELAASATPTPSPSSALCRTLPRDGFSRATISAG